MAVWLPCLSVAHEYEEDVDADLIDNDVNDEYEEEFDEEGFGDEEGSSGMRNRSS